MTAREPEIGHTTKQQVSGLHTRPGYKSIRYTRSNKREMAGKIEEHCIRLDKSMQSQFDKLLEKFDNLE